MLSGFRGDSVDITSGLALVEDSVTHLERRLYFSTAHFHLRAGCPALAVEVLSKLPNKIIDSSSANQSEASSTATSSRKQSDSTAKAVVPDATRSLETGIFDHSHALDLSQPVPTKRKTETADQTTSKTENPSISLLDSGGGSIDLDWSQSLSSAKGMYSCTARRKLTRK